MGGDANWWRGVSDGEEGAKFLGGFALWGSFCKVWTSEGSSVEGSGVEQGLAGALAVLGEGRLSEVRGDDCVVGCWALCLLPMGKKKSRSYKLCSG